VEPTDQSERAISTDDFDAVIFDLDGVVTHTASVHARAWKRAFDDFLERRAEREGISFQPFVIDRDYPKYVDGKPRYDGVRSFLEARGISLPEGDPSDGPEAETVCGLGNRKNTIYNQMLDEGGVDVFEDTVEQIRRWRKLELKTAIVSSSKNCQPVLEAAGLTDLFDVRVDGVVSAQLGQGGGAFGGRTETFGRLRGRGLGSAGGSGRRVRLGRRRGSDRQPRGSVGERSRHGGQ